MACLGGTVEAPAHWVRMNPVMTDEQGRICDRRSPRTSQAFCYGCPAYRGRDRDGVMQTGLAPNGDPVAFTPLEYELWMDDPDRFWRDKENGFDFKTIEGADRRAEYMRNYRATHPKYRAQEVALASARVAVQRRKVIRKGARKPIPGMGTTC